MISDVITVIPHFPPHSSLFEEWLETPPQGRYLPPDAGPHRTEGEFPVSDSEGRYAVVSTYYVDNPKDTRLALMQAMVRNEAMAWETDTFLCEAIMRAKERRAKREGEAILILLMPRASPSF